MSGSKIPEKMQRNLYRLCFKQSLVAEAFFKENLLSRK